MIKNERQYWVTRSEMERFERLLTESDESGAGDDDVHPLIAKARRDASNSRLSRPLRRTFKSMNR